MAKKKVFVSYSHQQGKWTLDRLVPCLSAGGVKVLIDVERFKAARNLKVQMDQHEDDADFIVLLISKEYLASKNCCHEMYRAVDRAVATGRDDLVVPVRLDDSKLPQKLSRLGLLYVDLRKDRNAAQWKLLMDAVQADLGTDAPRWLKARNDVRRFLQRNQSVNLVVQGDVAWRPLIKDLSRDIPPVARVDGLALADLHDPDTSSRRGLVTTIIRWRGTTCVRSPFRGYTGSCWHTPRNLRRRLSARSSGSFLTTRVSGWRLCGLGWR